MNKSIILFLTIIFSILLFVCSSIAEDDLYQLPMDFNFPNYEPNPSGFSGQSYHDDSLDISIEDIKSNGCKFHVARIHVKSPTQLRTALAGKPNVAVSALPSRMGRKLNAVLTINGEYYTQRTQDIYVYRQGFMLRNQPDPVKDVLIIDDKGDFHIFNTADKEEKIRAFTEAGGVPIQAFSFGPGLIIDGKRADLNPDYYFYPNMATQRTFIAQDGPLSYVCVYSEGSTHAQMADFADTLGLQNAYNLDGGMSAVMIFNGKYIGNRSKSSEREQSDIIYFVTAVAN